MKGITMEVTRAFHQLLGLAKFKLSKIEGTKKWGLWVNFNKKHGVFKLIHLI